jgi:hypothetical protein
MLYPIELRMRPRRAIYGVSPTRQVRNRTFRNAEPRTRCSPAVGDPGIGWATPIWAGRRSLGIATASLPQRSVERSHEMFDIGNAVVAVQRDPDPAGVVHDVNVALKQLAMDSRGVRVLKSDNARGATGLIPAHGL